MCEGHFRSAYLWQTENQSICSEGRQGQKNVPRPLKRVWNIFSTAFSVVSVPSVPAGAGRMFFAGLSAGRGTEGAVTDGGMEEKNLCIRLMKWNWPGAR